MSVISCCSTWSSIKKKVTSNLSSCKGNLQTVRWRYLFLSIMSHLVWSMKWMQIFFIYHTVEYPIFSVKELFLCWLKPSEEKMGGPLCMLCVSCEALCLYSLGELKSETKRVLEALVLHIYLNNNWSSCPLTSIQFSGGSQPTDFHRRYNCISKVWNSTILFLTFTDVMEI